MSEEKYEFLADLIVSQFGKLNAKMDRLGERMDRLEERMDRLEERMDNIEQEVASLREKIDSNKEELIQFVVETAESNYTMFKEELFKHDKRISKLEAIHNIA